MHNACNSQSNELLEKGLRVVTNRKPLTHVGIMIILMLMIMMVNIRGSDQTVTCFSSSFLHLPRPNLSHHNDCVDFDEGPDTWLSLMCIFPQGKVRDT